MAAKSAGHPAASTVIAGGAVSKHTQRTGSRSTHPRLSYSLASAATVNHASPHHVSPCATRATVIAALTPSEGRPRAGIPSPTPSSSASSSSSVYRCYLHGCNGRTFSDKGNYTRHIREQSRVSRAFCCFCGKDFSRKSNRDNHIKDGKCKVLKDANFWAQMAGHVKPEHAAYMGTYHHPGQVAGNASVYQQSTSQLNNVLGLQYPHPQALCIE